jgi:hypothetical protein
LLLSIIFNITEGAPSKNEDKVKFPVGEASVVNTEQLLPLLSQTYKVYGAVAPETDVIVIFDDIMKRS